MVAPFFIMYLALPCAHLCSSSITCATIRQLSFTLIRINTNLSCKKRETI
uniref:Uncharacterized protein n=1 Tax=Setaria italica TaxID=4555 RepID=K3XPA0_SETIT